MKILLFGAGGLLGRHLRQEPGPHEITALNHAQADITDAACLDELFCEPWDAVVNAAAICDFDACEKDPVRTGHVNRDAPLNLARRCRDAGCIFVQFSSDYVFSGALDRPLTEEDKPGPLSVYGRQKADLEREIPHICPSSLIVRLSWLYGCGGKTFMSLLPDLFLMHEALRVASGKKGRCLYARDAATWILKLIAEGRTGLVNLVNDGDTSWEEFARAALDGMKVLGMQTRCRSIEEVPYERLGANWSKRPRWSCLDISRLQHLHPPGPRPWREALASFLHEQKSVAALRPL